MGREQTTLPDQVGRRNDKKFPATISDVAFAAGVGISTVSNVLNHPYKVAAATQQKVKQAIADLDFQRSEEAVALRRGKRASPNRFSADVVIPPIDSDNTNRPDEALGGAPAAATYTPECLSPGTRVEILDDGRVMGSGVVDMSMADGSAVWLWMDCGGGRRLIHKQDGLGIRPL
ncbi:LacI family DNA-binding transcriptional regulator [Arthrobacter sp. StoSoilB22]|uniref:LacI family DNA-binding transcriptional regulator n=1 Tax=Arthrobacter sp. StoSoilB22 TaxID=2830996 RepID=UPI001CC36508|nr:LacI family DNA-binding transcriptional regulator [Arthrobacter sp. StoSoilB22]BCW62904.1 hypothetical protein StoSoilB22_18770 [Arthrobacter sp. StoSoilB22]